MTPRQKEQRDRIFDVVRSQIAISGYEGLSMRAVAKEANVATATLYNLYDSKDALIVAVLKRNIFRVSVFDRSEFSDPIAFYFAGTQAIFDDLVESPGFARAMMRIFFNAEPEDEVVEVIMANRFKSDRAILLELEALGYLKAEQSIETLVFRLAGNSISGLLFWMKGGLRTPDVPGYILQRDLEVFETCLSPEGLRLLEPIKASNDNR